MDKISNKKILLVEDDDINIDVISTYLRGKYDFDLAVNGTEALQMCQKNDYDVILLDINLGRGLTGIDVVKVLKQDDKYANKPIIAITAYAMRGDREIFLEAGCTDYLPKPFTEEELIAMIEKQ